MLQRIGKVRLLVALTGIVAACLAGYFVVAPRAMGMGEGKTAVPEAAKEEASVPGLMFSIKERVVNLADPGGRRYLKITMYVEFSTYAEELRRVSLEERKKKQEEFDKDIAPQAPLIEDAVISLLGSKTSTDVASPEGRQLVKSETVAKLNHVLGGEKVTNVYFTQFLIQ